MFKEFGFEFLYVLEVWLCTSWEFGLGFHNLSEKVGPSLNNGSVDLEELIVAAEQHLAWILTGVYE